MPEMEILMADDDQDDCDMAVEALRAAGITNPIRFVCDGAELVNCLYALVEEKDGTGHEWPALVLLDLNMPRMDGLTALKEVKGNPALAEIPVVILSTSDNQNDVNESYRLGAQSYVVKPARLKDWIEKFHNMERYWFKTVALPVGRHI